MYKNIFNSENTEKENKATKEKSLVALCLISSKRFYLFLQILFDIGSWCDKLVLRFQKNLTKERLS